MHVPRVLPAIDHRTAVIVDHRGSLNPRDFSAERLTTRIFRSRGDGCIYRGRWSFARQTISGDRYASENGSIFLFCFIFKPLF